MSLKIISSDIYRINFLQRKAQFGDHSYKTLENKQKKPKIRLVTDNCDNASCRSSGVELPGTDPVRGRESWNQDLDEFYMNKFLARTCLVCHSVHCVSRVRAAGAPCTLLQVIISRHSLKLARVQSQKYNVTSRRCGVSGLIHSAGWCSRHYFEYSAEQCYRARWIMFTFNGVWSNNFRH